jgi:DNA-binding NtrC family response regulator
MKNLNDDYRGTETILVVDDDEQVIDITANILMSYGYKVITAFDGQEGVEQYKLNSDNIDLIIMDIVMPRKDGITAYKEIININKNAIIILSSGFNNINLAVFNDISVLQKPYKSINLLETIRNKLD